MPPPRPIKFDDLSRQGRTKDAIRSYERSLRLNPENANAKTMLEALRR